MPAAIERSVIIPQAQQAFRAFHERDDVKIHYDTAGIEPDFAAYESSKGDRKFKVYSIVHDSSLAVGHLAGYMRIFEIDDVNRMQRDRPVLEMDVEFNDTGDLVGLKNDQFHAVYREGEKEYFLRYSVDKDEPHIAYLSQVSQTDVTNQIAASVLTPEEIQSLHLTEKGFANRTAWADMLMQYVQGDGIIGDSIDSHLIQGLAYTRQDLQRFSQEKKQLSEGVTIEELVDKTERRIPLTRAEIFGLVNEYVAGSIDDDQMAEWITAVYDHGLSLEETIDLTMAMAASGEVLDMAQFSPDGIVADKHSSGGVGDKTSLVVAPLVAACDVTVGKMSGRGLGHTGGTLDKMEAIPSSDGKHTLNVKLSREQFIQQVKDIRIVISGQSDDLAPADGKIYALRNKIGKIASIPLIASSIMSKKIASGCNVLVLDVTVGNGAFMKTVDEAHQLARIMVDIGKALGMKVKAELSNMDMPRGYTVGNALEVREAVEILNGDIISQEFYDHCIGTAAEIVQMAYEMKGMILTDIQARNMVEDKIKDGSALKKFKQMVEAQGGDVSVIDDTGKLPQASLQAFVYLPASASGYIQSIHALEVGEVSMELGGGRLDYKDRIDPAVGIEVGINVGQWVDEKYPLFRISANDQQKLEVAILRLQKSIEIGQDIPDKPQLIYEIVE